MTDEEYTRPAVSTPGDPLERTCERFLTVLEADKTITPRVAMNALCTLLVELAQLADVPRAELTELVELHYNNAARLRRESRS